MQIRIGAPVDYLLKRTSRRKASIREQNYNVVGADNEAIILCCFAVLLEIICLISAEISSLSTKTDARKTRDDRMGMRKHSIKYQTKPKINLSFLSLALQCI